MTDYNVSLTIQSIWLIIRIVVDIAVVWFVFYYAIKFVRNNTRTIQIFKGIVAILAVNGISKLLGLTTVEYFSNLFVNWGFLAAIIIFQPEIRSLLERIGRTNPGISTLLANEKESLVNALYDATVSLSEQNIGALISIEQTQSLQDYIRTGVEMNAKASVELLCSIFMTTTPLHDGAVIIQGNRVACASAYFPPTSTNLSSKYGARHRAALGIAEVSDCLTIVVSEETSAISIAQDGKIFIVEKNQLKDYLKRVILNDKIEIKSDNSRRNLLLEDDDIAFHEERKEIKTPFNNREKALKHLKKEVEDEVIVIKENKQ